MKLEGFGSGQMVLIVDEAGMASTRETARVMAHARAAAVKVIAIGDSGQLSSVQAGRWLGSLTERLGCHELREVMRQRDPRERQLLAHVRRGDPTELTVSLLLEVAGPVITPYGWIYTNDYVRNSWRW